VFPGLHIEGPFIASEKGPRGAHPKKYCRAPEEIPGFLSDIQKESGSRISIITLAPELKGAVDLIREAVVRGICAGIGHTGASPAQIETAIQAGAKLSTHLGNESHQFLPKHENYIQYQLGQDALVASFIADGHHMPFYTLKNFIKAKGPERSILVTDAIAAAELGAGSYKLGHEEVVVREDLHVSKPGEQNLAGSALTLDRAIINTVIHCGVPFEETWKMASKHPASLIGLPNLPQITVEINNNVFKRAD